MRRRRRTWLRVAGACLVISVAAVLAPVDSAAMPPADPRSGVTAASGRAHYTDLPAVVPRGVTPGAEGDRTWRLADDPQQVYAEFLASVAAAERGDPLPVAITPPPVLKPGQESPIPRAKCASAPGTTTTEICYYGDLSSSKVVAVVGDSHIAQWLPALDWIGKERNLKLMPLIKSSCLPIVGLTVYRHDQTTLYTDCRQFRDWTLQKLTEVRPYAILMSGWVQETVYDEANGTKASEARGTELFRRASLDTMRKFKAITPRVQVIGDNPTIPYRGFDCLTLWRTQDVCAKPLKDLIRTRNLAWLWAARASGAGYINMMPFFCYQDRVCPVLVNATNIYWDHHHLTHAYPWRLRHALDQRLDF